MRRSGKPTREAEPLWRLPALAERARLDLEGPRRWLLLGETEGGLGDVVRLDEEGVGLVRHALTRPRDIDGAIDDDDRDVHARRPEIPRHRFGQAALRGLRRRK